MPPVALKVSMKSARKISKRRIPVKDYNETSDSEDDVVPRDLVMSDFADDEVSSEVEDEKNDLNGACLNKSKQYQRMIKRDQRPDLEVDESRKVPKTYNLKDCHTLCQFSPWYISPFNAGCSVLYEREP